MGSVRCPGEPGNSPQAARTWVPTPLSRPGWEMAAAVPERPFGPAGAGGPTLWQTRNCSKDGQSGPLGDPAGAPPGGPDAQCLRGRAPGVPYGRSPCALQAVSRPGGKAGGCRQPRACAGCFRANPHLKPGGGGTLLAAPEQSSHAGCDPQGRPGAGSRLGRHVCHLPALGAGTRHAASPSPGFHLSQGRDAGSPWGRKRGPRRRALGSVPTYRDS